MQLPIQYWKNTLTRLGVRVERRPALQRSSASRFSVEMLERRQVMAADVIVDDSQIGFQITSLDWSLGSSGYLNESHIHTGGTGAAGAKWHVEGLTAGGQYQVFTTWAPDVGNATNTPLSVTNGTTTLGTVRVNQTIAPNDVESLGTAWKSLGVFETSSGVLDIKITNDADGTVVADAVRLVEIRPTITGLTASPNPVALGSQVTLTATGVSDPGGNAIAEVRFYRDVNGDGVLTAADGSPVATDTSSSGGWSVSASTVSLPAGTNRFFAVAKDTTGVESDPVSVTATVLSPTRIIDDEDSGYSVLSGTWTESNTGYNNDHYYSYFNNGAVEWRFSNVVPGTYRVSATWLSASNRASAAPYEILDNTNSLATVFVNQKNAPAANVVAGGRNFQDLGTFEVVNGQLVVRLTNTTATTLCADAIRLEHIGPVQGVPEIRVYDGTSELFDAASTINFGSTFVGALVTKTFTVKNVGVGNLVLTQLTQATMPAGYTLVSGLGSTTLTQGQSTTFTVALSADAAATSSGMLSLVTNDADEGSFDITLTGVVSAVTIKDDEDPGYSVLSGTWTKSNSGYNNDHYFSYFNASAVEWKFSNLVPGTYRVSATWTSASNRASAAPYQIIDGTNGLATVQVNQKNAPVANATAGGVNFQHLGSFVIVNGQLVVRVSNTTATTLSADAIRLEYLGPVQSVSEIRVFDGASELTDGTTIVGFGSTFFGTPVQKTLTVQNVGVAALTLTQLTQASMPAGYRLVSGLGATTLAQGQSTTFTVELTAKTPGTAAGTISILNNDPDEGSFDIPVTGFVNAVRVIDDEDTGFSIVSGIWQKSHTGYNNDHFFVYSGDFGVVQWQFANLPVGQYRVSAAWAEHPNRTSIAPYTLLDGASPLGTVQVNQKLPAAANRTEGGRPFQDLGVFAVVNGSLVVKLADTTSLAVSADAIRIEYVGGPEIRYASSGPSLVIDGTPATAVDFGPSERANKTVKYLAVTNTTAADITLTQLTQADMPAGYVLESGFSSLTVAPGGISFFRVRLDAITPGTYAGPVAIQSTAGAFQLNVTGDVIKTPVVVDDGDPEFRTTGTGWQSVAYGSGFNDDLRRATGPSGSNTARWTVDGLAPGTYMVYASYLSSSANTAAAPYKLYDGATLEQQFFTNQRVAGNDVTVSGMGFGYVGQINVSSGTLAVELNASGVSDGWAIADAVYVVPVTGGYFHQFAAPSQMVTGSANVLTAGFVDPDSTIADSIRVYRDSNNNGVLNLATDQLLFTQTAVNARLPFDLASLATGTTRLFVVAVKNDAVVASTTTTVTAAEWWRVKLSGRNHGEAGFTSSGDLTTDATPIKLAKTTSPTWWAPAVWNRVSGTVSTYNTEQDAPNVVVHQYDFPSGAFDVGTATTLGAAHAGFNAPGGSPDQKLVVLEDLTASLKPANDGDYDDQYWVVTMQPLVLGDVDVDSDNTGPIDHSDFEESIEDSAPGRLVSVTLPTDSITKTAPLAVTLIDAPVSTTKLRFSGDSSLFRLRSANGTVIAFETVIAASSVGNENRFFVEALKAGTGSISVDADPLGDGQWTYVDSVTLSGYLVDIDTDSNNDGGIDGSNAIGSPDDSIETIAPGRVVAVRENGVGDLAEVRIRPFGVSIPSSVSAIATLEALGNIKVYVDAEGLVPLFVGNATSRSWNAADPDLPQTVYVAGDVPGQASLKWTVTAAGTTTTDSVAITILRANLDTDSNNSGGIDPADDPIENDAPGRYVAVSDDDPVALAPVTISPLAFTSAGSARVTVTLTRSPGINVYGGTGESIFANGELSRTWQGTDELPAGVSVAGATPGVASLTWTINVGVYSATDKVTFTVIPVNIDTDSDNGGGVVHEVDSPIEEDAPGRILSLRGIAGATLAETKITPLGIAPTRQGELKATLTASNGLSVYADAAGTVPLIGPGGGSKSWDPFQEVIPYVVYVAGDVLGQGTVTWTVSAGPDDALAGGNVPGVVVANDSTRFTVILVDLDTDSNNDGNIDPDNSLLGTDDPVETVPFLRTLRPTVGPDALVAIVAQPLTTGSLILATPMTITYDDKVIRLYAGADRATPIPSGGEVVPGSIVYAEAVAPGTTLVTWSLVTSVLTALDSVMLSVDAPKVDLDTDSDNNEPNSVAGSDAEEDVEAGDNPGKRIFVNNDDDNQNGMPDKVDDDMNADGPKRENDFAMIKLKKIGKDAMAGDTMVLLVPSALRLWALNAATGRFELQTTTEWEVGPNGQLAMPGTLYVEGIEPGSHVVTLEQRDRKGKLVDSDTINISVEKIIYPFVNDQEPAWQDKPTARWKGVALADGWGITNALINFIVAPTDLGKIETRRPDRPDKQATIAVNVDSSVYIPIPFIGVPQNGFQITFTFAFPKDHGPDATGYVQGVPVQQKASFIGNSGVKFGSVDGKDVEISILDVKAMLQFAAKHGMSYDYDVISKSDKRMEWKLGIQSLYPDAKTKAYYEGVTQMLSGIRYGARLANLQTGSDLAEDVDITLLTEPPLVAETGEVEDWVLASMHTQLDQLFDNATAKTAPGEMVIDVTRNEAGTYDLMVRIGNVTTYTETSLAFAMAVPRFQSHWGSGVTFSEISYATH